MLAPGQQGVEHRNECVAGFGEPVFVAARSVVIRRSDDDACALQGLQPRRDAVAGGAGARDDVAEAGCAERDLPHDEQRPSFADKLERRGDGAGPPRKVGQRCGGHAASLPAVSLKIKLTALCYERRMTETAFGDLDDYFALPRVSGLAVSPDGSRVVTTVSELNDKRTEYVNAIWEVDPEGVRQASSADPWREGRVVTGVHLRR